MEEEKRQRMRKKFEEAGERSALINMEGAMSSLPSNEIESILLDCRNMLMQCESTTIGQTQIKLKILQIENLYRKLKLSNGA